MRNFGISELLPNFVSMHDQLASSASAGAALSAVTAALRLEARRAGAAAAAVTATAASVLVDLSFDFATVFGDARCAGDARDARERTGPQRRSKAGYARLHNF